MLMLAKLVGDQLADANTLEKTEVSRKARILAVMGYTENHPADEEQRRAASNLHRLFPWAPNGVHGGTRYTSQATLCYGTGTSDPGHVQG